MPMMEDMLIDGAAAVGQHITGRLPVAQEHALEVNVNDPVPLVQGHLLSGSPGADAGIGHHNIQAAHLFRGSPDHGGNLLLIGDITGHGIHRSALLAQFLGGGVDGFLIDVGNGHHGACRAEGLGNGQSQSLAPPVTSACFPSRENKFR